MDGTVLHVRPAEGGEPADPLDVGDALDAPRLAVRTVTMATAREAVSDAACVVVEHGDSRERTLEAVAALRECSDRPIIVHSQDPDGRLAAAATRRGATEYHHGESNPALAGRVRAQLRGELSNGRTATEAAETDGAEGTATEDDTVGIGATADLFQIALESTDTAVFEWRVGDEEIFWHASAARLFGIGDSSGYRPAEEFFECIVPEDRDRVRDAVETAVETGRIDGTYRIERPDSERRWLRTRGEIVSIDGVDRLVGVTQDVTERQEREDELRRYRTVLENIQDMVYVVDAEERFTLVTDPLARWLGYDREELEGADPREVLTAEAKGEFAAEIADMWHDDGEGGQSRRLRTSFITAAGESKPAEVEVSLLPSDEGFAGSVGVVRDRSELVETRQQLAHQRNRFSYLFDNLPDAVVETVFRDGEPIVRTVNEAFTETFGYDADVVRGESLNEFILPADRREQGQQLDERARAGEVQTAEIRRKTATGYRDFLFRGVPYESDDGVIRGFGIYTDITDQKERARRLQVLNRVLRHNLRNDLNVMLGYADMLADGIEDPELATRAETLREKTVAVASLGERARDLETTVGRGSPRDESVDLRPLVASVLESVQSEYPDLSVDVDLPDLAVVGDDRLEIVIRELLENVAEHASAAGPPAGGDTVVADGAAGGERGRSMEDGGTERTGPHARVEAVDVTDDALLGIRIADDGPGLPDNEQAVLSQSEQITKLHHGTGLGLWVSRWLCESCGGRLRPGESPLGGAAVVIELIRE